MNNDIAYYQAEIDYRREHMRDREQIRLWRRARSLAARRNRTH